jgi:hypothetical protein
MPSNKVRTKLYFFSCHGAASNFTSLEKATEAAEVYSLDRGYPVEAFFCDACRQYHMRQSEAPREIPEEDRWTPGRHRALRARIKAENEARRAEWERVRAEKRTEEERVRALKYPKKEIVRCRRVKGRSESERRSDLRARRLAAGVCTVCGGTRAPERNTCERCHARNKKTADAYRLRSVLPQQKPSKPARVKRVATPAMQA